MDKVISIKRKSIRDKPENIKTFNKTMNDKIFTKLEIVTVEHTQAPAATIEPLNVIIIIIPNQ
jgi:hypothetical protein